MTVLPGAATFPPAPRHHGGAAASAAGSGADKEERDEIGQGYGQRGDEEDHREFAGGEVGSDVGQPAQGRRWVRFAD